MTNETRWALDEQTKEALIDALTPELSSLRMKADISQGELANLIGISRQTYGAIERQTRRMTWSTYLSLIMFYDCNQKTHQFLRAIGAFPNEIIRRFNEGAAQTEKDMLLHLGADMAPLMEGLDAQALQTIRNMIMLEYARCKRLPGDIVIKSFDGKSFTMGDMPDPKGRQALAAIKERYQKHDG